MLTTASIIAGPGATWNNTCSAATVLLHILQFACLHAFTTNIIKIVNLTSTTVLHPQTLFASVNSNAWALVLRAPTREIDSIDSYACGACGSKDCQGHHIQDDLGQFIVELDFVQLLWKENKGQSGSRKIGEETWWWCVGGRAPDWNQWWHHLTC